MGRPDREVILPTPSSTWPKKKGEKGGGKEEVRPGLGGFYTSPALSVIEEELKGGGEGAHWPE